MRHAAAITRRGGVYVLVLVAVLSCAAMVVGGLELVRANHRASASATDYWQAQANAAAALEMAVSEVETSHDWRWAKGDGVWFSKLAMPDGGTVTVEASGVKTDAWDTVTLTAIGEHGRARAISSVEMGLQLAGGPAQTGPGLGTAGVLAWWPLSGATSDWDDEAILGRGAAEENYGAGTTYRGALPGPGVLTAPWFWGSSSLVLGDEGNLSSIRSIAFWFFAEDVSARQSLVERAVGLSFAGEWMFSVQDGRLHATYTGLSSLLSSTDAPVAAGRWHHVVLVAEANRTVLYLDGAAVDTAGMLLTNYWKGSSLPPIRVAGFRGSFGGLQYPYEGSVCDLIVMSEPMTGSQVLALYNAYAPAGTYRVLAEGWKRETR